MSEVAKAPHSFDSALIQTLPRSTPEENGIASSAITEFLHAVQREQLGLHSFMLLRHGKVLAEAWWSPYGPDRPHMMFSVSKSFTSTAVGLAIAEGRLTVEDRVVSFFPDKRISDNAYLQELRVKHLLTMSTGHNKETMSAAWGQADWVQAILAEPIEQEPGTVFMYHNGATYLLSAIIQRLTGQTTHDYLQPRLFRPLGIEETAWEVCPRGISTGGWGLSLKTEDLAKFGQLYLQRGVWAGQRLIPEAWVDEATSYQVSTEHREKPDSIMGYGYQFWRSRHESYRGAGAYGQFCLILPRQEAVVVMTAGTGNMQGMLNQVWDHLLPEMKEHPIPPDEEAHRSLLETAASVCYAPIASRQIVSNAGEISGNRYALSENNMKIQNIEWHFEADKCIVKAWTQQGELEFRCGLGHWLEARIPLRTAPELMLGSGGWQGPDTFVMCWRAAESVFAEVFACEFAQDRVTITVQQADPSRTGEAVVIEGKRE